MPNKCFENVTNLKYYALIFGSEKELQAIARVEVRKLKLGLELYRVFRLMNFLLRRSTSLHVAPGWLRLHGVRLREREIEREREIRGGGCFGFS